jgi:Bacteriophage minor capsid protein
MVLDDLGVFLHTLGLGTLGTSLFKGRVPHDAPGSAVPDELIALFSTPGLPPAHTHDISGPSVEQPVVQVRVRGGTAPGAYASAWAKAYQAFLALDAVKNATINGVFYQRILALQSPFGQPDDQYNRPFVVFHVRCLKSPS